MDMAKIAGSLQITLSGHFSTKQKKAAQRPSYVSSLICSWMENNSHFKVFLFDYFHFISKLD